MRALAAVFLTVSLAVGTSCTSGRHRESVPPTHPSPGYATPGAAVMGFFTNYVAGKGSAACAYVIQSDFLSCDEALTLNNTTATFTGLGVGQTTIRGSQALVSVVGKLCVTQAGKTNCRQNSNTSAGQPFGTSQKAFDSLYSKANVGRPINTSALPCEKVSGKWYINLEGSQSS